MLRQDERRPAIENITERGQLRPADWPKAFPAHKFEDKDIATSRDSWTWIKLATVGDLSPTEHNTTSVLYFSFRDEANSMILQELRCSIRRGFAARHLPRSEARLLCDAADVSSQASVRSRSRNYRGRRQWQLTCFLSVRPRHPSSLCTYADIAIRSVCTSETSDSIPETAPTTANTRFSPSTRKNRTEISSSFSLRPTNSMLSSDRRDGWSSKQRRKSSARTRLRPSKSSDRRRMWMRTRRRLEWGAEMIRLRRDVDRGS